MSLQEDWSKPTLQGLKFSNTTELHANDADLLHHLDWATLINQTWGLASRDYHSLGMKYCCCSLNKQTHQQYSFAISVVMCQDKILPSNSMFGNEDPIFHTHQNSQAITEPRRVTCHEQSHHSPLSLSRGCKDHQLLPIAGLFDP